MKGLTAYQAKEKAQELGATHYRTYFTNTKYDRSPEPFSIHFFCDGDIEIGMYSYDLGKLCGMQVFEKPRVWSKEFKLHPNYSEPIDFKSSCVYHKYTKAEIGGLFFSN